MPRLTPYAAHEIAMVSRTPCGSGLPIGLIPGALPSDQASRQTLNTTAIRFPPGQRQFGLFTEESPLRLTARKETLGQGEAILRDVSGARVPDPVSSLVLDTMPDRLAQRSQAKRLANDEPVQGQRKDQRLALRLLKQFLELIDDHLGELAAGVVAVRQRAGIVQFHRIGHRK